MPDYEYVFVSTPSQYSNSLWEAAVIMKVDGLLDRLAAKFGFLYMANRVSIQYVSTVSVCPQIHNLSPCSNGFHSRNSQGLHLSVKVKYVDFEGTEYDFVVLHLYGENDSLGRPQVRAESIFRSQHRRPITRTVSW